MLVEPRACGIPVVTTATESIPEVVEDAATVVPPYAPDRLAGALAALRDPQRCASLAAAGLQRVAESYVAERVAASIGDIYRRLLV